MCSTAEAINKYLVGEGRPYHTAGQKKSKLNFTFVRVFLDHTQSKIKKIACKLFQNQRVAKKPGQELMQKKSVMCPPLIHYLTPSAPIKTDEVTLHSVLLLDL